MNVGNKAVNRNFRTSSLRIVFGQDKPMPTDLEIFTFFKKVGFVADSLKAMYKEVKEYSIYVMFKSDAEMDAAYSKVKESVVFTYASGLSVTVTVSVASNKVKYVRLFGLPPDILDSEIAQVLSKHGKIYRMIREKYGFETGFPIWNGVRGIHMEVTKEIPATMHVLHFQARVYYDGLQNRCFSCGATDHLKMKCPKRQTVNDRMKQNYGGEDGREAEQDQPSQSNVAKSYSQVLGSSSAANLQLNLVTLTPKTGLIRASSEKKETIERQTNADQVDSRQAEPSQSSEESGQAGTGKEESGQTESSKAASPQAGSDQAMETQADDEEENEISVAWEVVRGKRVKRTALTKTNSSDSSEGGDEPFKVPEAPDLLKAQRTRSRSKQRKLSDKTKP